MFSTMSSWWSKGGEEAGKGEIPAEPKEITGDSVPTQVEEGSQSPDQNGDNRNTGGEKSPTEELQEASAMAVNAAKDWGNYLFTFGKKATEAAVKTAVSLKDTVEEKTIIGHFNKEQEKFVTEKAVRKKTEEAAVAPWVGYHEEEAMKKQILALSADKRNFVRNPPAGVQFSFDFVTASPVAMVMLQEDPNLEAMRFELVPKQMKEEVFWRNYFYRVSLIKQSAQLTTLAQQTGSDSHSSKSSRTSSIESLHKDKAATEAASKKTDAEPEDLPTASPTEHEFASDAFDETQINEEDLKKEMQMLGMTDSQNERLVAEDDDIPEWERELQAELQEYEVVDDDGAELDDADLEKEILQQIEAEAHQQTT